MLCNGGSFQKNKQAIMKCLQTGERMNLSEDSFYVEYDREHKLFYLRNEGMNSGSCVVMYRIDELNDYAVLPYYIQGAIEGYLCKDKGLPF